jgi:sodium-dependent dicarboxylate transporter 2/3/5
MSLKPVAVEDAIQTPPKGRSGALGVAASFAVFAIVLLLPAPEGLSVQGQRMAALFLGILVLWTTEALPIAVTAILALILQPILGLNPLGAAFTNFISPVFFFVMVMFTIAFAWVKTGLARRFALWMISKAGTDAKRTIYVFVIGAGLISTIVSDVPCAAIFMAIALGILQKLNLKPGESSFGRALMLGIPIGALIGGVGTPAGSSINILGLIMIEQNGGERVPFLHWMAIGMPMVIILLPLGAWITAKFFPPEIKSIGDLSEIQEERARLGPITSHEWKVIVIMTAMVTAWILGTWYPAMFDTVLVGMTGAALMFFPGIQLFTWKEVQDATAWDILMITGGVTTLGAASSSSGLAKWLVNATMGGLQEWHIMWVIAVISAFTIVFRLVVPIGPVINAILIPPMMVLGAAAGVNPALYALPVIFTASAAFLLPLDAVPLVTYSKGYYRMFDMFLPGVVLSVVWIILMTTLVMFVGPAIGLL